MDRYLHLFTISEADETKKYKISIDKEDTKKGDQVISLHCNCPTCNDEKTWGRNCEHIKRIWSEINLAYNNHGINGFAKPHILAAQNRDWLICNEDWFNDSPIKHLGDIGVVHTTWKITKPFDPFPEQNSTQRIRMCCSCDFPQETPLDKRIFSCQNCGRLQRI